ncbi:MAG: helix-turn-helix domain-containing protein [Oscillospiraceae bacterium]|jgi:excisionase family DNA binding protein|nr:helix-turn-helix domain-containing protein [Oscillospiraceae bacterium]
MPGKIKDHPLLLTVPQAAELMQLGRDTVYQLTHRPDFPALRLGRTVRINREGLQDWLNKNNGGNLL